MSKQFLKNWRPFSLLNCVYKLVSGCITHRIKTTLNKLIDKDQSDFIKGRFIDENIKLVYGIMDYTDLNTMPVFYKMDFISKSFFYWKEAVNMVTLLPYIILLCTDILAAVLFC